LWTVALGGALLVSLARADESGQERAQAAGSALIGTPAPALKLTTIDGQILDLGAVYGKKAVYLKFWATWCVPCLQQMPHFEHAYETEGDDVLVVGINTNFNETPQGVRDYRRKHGLQMPIVIDDGRLAAALNLRVTPQHVLIARDGRIAYVGHLADEALDLELAALRQSNSHAPPAQSAAAKGATRRPSRVVTSDGQTFTLRDPKAARQTVLVFLSPWCESYLKESRPAMSAQCRRVREGADQLVGGSARRWLGVSSGLWANEADLKDYQHKNSLKMPVALDAGGDLFRGFNVTLVPTVIVLDAAGKEVGRGSGETLNLEALLASASARS
jgi:peroxiredoxin